MFSASPDVVVPENLPGPGNYGFVQTNLVSNIEGMALENRHQAGQSLGT